MGFRTGAYATIWEVTPEKEFSTKLQLSISRKNKDGEYETEFSGFVYANGTGAAKKAAQLQKRDRIRLGDVDVTTTYNKEKKITYTNYKVYNFATSDDEKFNLSAKEFVAAINDITAAQSTSSAKPAVTQPNVEPEAADDLPW